MPTNIELQETIKDKNKEIDQLKKQVDELLKQKETVESQAKESKGLSGFIVTTPSKAYNGVTMGIQFRNGRGIVLDSPEAHQIVTALRNDFGYEVTHSDNLQGAPELTNHVNKSMIEILTQ